MTLISFFDEDPLDNIGDILYLEPETCIFIGESSVINRRRKNSISRFLEQRGMEITVEYICIPYGDVEEARDRLARLVMDYPDCVLDVTGGTEMMIALAGYIAGKWDIPLYQRKGRSGQMLWQLDCDLSSKKVALTVPEAVGLHSGAIISSTPVPDLGEALSRQIPLLWEIARQNPGAYNSTCNGLSYLTENNELPDTLEVVVPGQVFEDAPYIDPEILLSLEKHGFIQNLNAQWGGISFTFCSQEIRSILTKAGTLLELVTCLAARHADDRAVGVVLDWDGTEMDKAVIQTRNEIDVMLTFGLLPVCISCKNGVFGRDALYELDTVSRHFAGRYAKRLLVASYVDKDQVSVDYLRRRAHDMNIVPLFDVHKYTFDALAKVLQKHLPQTEG